MKNKLIFSHERTEQYKANAKHYWNRTYEKEGYCASHNAGSLEKTIEVAQTEMDLFLFPTEEKCTRLYADRETVPIPTFGPSFFLHENVQKYLGDDLSHLTALEYGCGFMGRYSLAMADYFKKVHAIDVSAEAVKNARKFGSDRLNINYHVNNGVDLSFIEDGSVDFVFSNLVFQHIGNKEIIYSITEEISRVLKVGGIIRAEYSNSHDKKDVGHANPYSGNGFDCDELIAMYSECGLTTETITEDRYFMWITGVKK